MGRKAKVESDILEAEILSLKNEIISEDGKSMLIILKIRN